MFFSFSRELATIASPDENGEDPSDRSYGPTI